MKILNPRDSHLTNAEVLSHLQEMRARHTQLHLTHGPVYSLKSGNLETVTKEVKDYLASLTPCSDAGYFAAAGSSSTTKRNNLARFMREMAKFKLEKVELLMLVNNRPESQAELYLMVEDVEGRLSEEEQDEVLRVVKGCFGGSYGEEDGEGEGEERGFREAGEYYGGDVNGERDEIEDEEELS